MAIGVNRVHFFIAILCIALVLHPGGARRSDEITNDDPKYDCYATAECPLSNETCLQNCQRRENMAIGVNRVHFFIAILCIALVLHPGGARRSDEITNDDPKYDCYATAECPLSNETCLQNCQRRDLLAQVSTST
ncbi:unnamed protein product [Vicia faba]|uniref:Uncharacterized protein n=1 Tax=Vicia faba TaxID=3906 RepID=A0AAV0YIE6_VICFA|nr:unnamed protein product [Vicia faba]